MKKRFYENFMKIEMSKKDVSNVEIYLNEELPIYSKIIVQFEEGFELEKFDEEPIPYDEFNENMACWVADYKKSQHIYYSISKSSFSNVVEYFNDYDCMIFQFKFIE